MSHSDPVADFLTRLRNAQRAGHRYVDMRANKLIYKIAEVLKEANFVEHILMRTEGAIQEMRVFLKYGPKRRPILQTLRRVSSPGARRYLSAEKIPRIMNGLGMAIISTSRGVMSGQKARQMKIGGEYLCYVW
jgi:small subunit ribosomal protein S8